MRPISLAFLLFPQLLLAAAGPRVLQEWTFDRDGDTKGWTANAHITGFGARDGALQAKAVGSDPILLSPQIEFSPASLAWVEVRLRSTSDGSAKFFWAPAKTGRYGGFESKKLHPFHVVQSSEYRTYQITPPWFGEAAIYRLRINVADGAAFSIASVRVLALDGARQGWSAIGAHPEMQMRNGQLTVRTRQAAVLAAPSMSVNTGKAEWIALRATCNKKTGAYVWWFNAAERHYTRVPLALIGDGRPHVYNVNAGGSAGWSGNAVTLGIELPENTDAAIDWFRVSEQPEGAGDVVATALTPARAINRAGAPFDIVCELTNRGGASADVRVHLALSANARILKKPAPPAPLGFGETTRLVWTAQAEKPGDVTATLGGAATASAVIHVTAKPNVARADYVPQPKPVKGDYEIGAYYYPGWSSSIKWDPVRKFPERTPVLGFYKEGDATVADWHIKYLSEHGIRFLAIDWYWRDGAETINHSYPGLTTARYRDLLKFCFLYANHDPFGIKSRDELMNITRFWIEKYFQRPQFYTVDGKPVIIIFSPGNFRTVLGAGTREALEASRELARKAGLPGIYYVACVGPTMSAEQMQQMKDDGWDALSAYNHPGVASGGSKRAPYSALVDGYAKTWDTFLSANVLPYWVHALPGWDPRPWHGEDTLVRTNNTPAEFRRMLQLAKQRIDKQSRKILLIEAWNEWGEGSTIEPDLETGFARVDAVRDVFFPNAGPHIDVAPTDVGLPLIEWDSAAEPAPVWSFREAGGMARWGITQSNGKRVEGGALRFRTTGTDPTLSSPAFRAPARKFGKVEIRMRVSKNSQVQLFWRIDGAPGVSEIRSVKFAATAADMRTYEIPMAANPHWRGTITQLRVDAASEPGVDVEIESIAMR